MGTGHRAQGARVGVITACVVCLVSCAFFLAVPCSAQVSGPSAPKDLARGVAHYILGVQHDLLGRQAAAVGEYAQSVRWDGQAFQVRLRLGMGYARLGQYAKAVDELSAASRIKPDDLQAHYFLALVYSSLRDIPRATAEYETLLKGMAVEDPRNVELFSYLGELYFSQGEDDKALEQFERVVALDPKNTNAMYVVGSCYLERNRRQEAVDLFKRCLAQDPMEDGCLNSLSYTYAEDGVQLDEALALVNRALEIRADHAAYLDTRGWVYYRKGMYAQAMKDLSRAADLVQDPTIQDHLGDVAFQLDRFEEARRYWQESLALDPHQPGVRSKLESLEKAGRMTPSP